MLTLTYRPSNDLTRFPNALPTTTLHPRPLPIVLNSSKQPGIVGDTSTKFTDLSGPSKTHPRSFPTSLRLHKTSPDHYGRERSAVRSAKCDRGFTHCCPSPISKPEVFCLESGSSLPHWNWRVLDNLNLRLSISTITMLSFIGVLDVQHVVMWRRHTSYIHKGSLMWTDLWIYQLTHWGRGKMAAIFQTTFSNAFSWMKMYEFRLRFHWSLFLRFELTIFHHWFR